jgi:pyruvate dehydrogenase E1 component alpha subunit/2-oxoisovalerate dehydrogenase E1 component alpha subunit
LIRNNGYAISTPESVQTAAASLTDRAAGYGMPGLLVDGNDLLAVVHTVRQAVDRARAGGGPTLIEARTYRLGAHSTADDPSAYRSDEERKSWLRVDALARLKGHAAWRGIWENTAEEELRASAEEEINRLIAGCEKWPPPGVESLFDDVYESLPSHLQEQKNELLKLARRHR